MKVFISWSKERSRRVGELLDEWLQGVLQAIRPWISTKNIEKGSWWFNEINNQLSDVSLGIVCLTSENLKNPWILFESGVLSKGLSSNRVFTLLIDIEPSDIEGPLSHFNHSKPDKDGIYKMVTALNKLLGESALESSVLERVFNLHWKIFKEEFDKIIKETEVQQKEEVTIRSEEDILSEILSITRSLDRRVSLVESRENKSKSNSKYYRGSLSSYLDKDSENKSFNEFLKSFSDDCAKNIIVRTDSPNKFIIQKDKEENNKE